MADSSSRGDAKVIAPVVQEELKIGTKTVDSGGGVRLDKHVTRQTEHVDVPVWREQLEVEHVARDVMLDPAQPRPEARHEGDTLVVPVLEEVLVVVKQLRLKEEVRITRHRQQVNATADVDLAREDVTVTRFDEDAGH